MGTKRNGRIRGGVAVWALGLAAALALCATPAAWASGEQAIPALGESPPQIAPNDTVGELPMHTAPTTGGTPNDPCAAAQEAWAYLAELQAEFESLPATIAALIQARNNAELEKTAASNSVASANMDLTQMEEELGLADTVRLPDPELFLEAQNVYDAAKVALEAARELSNAKNSAFTEAQLALTKAQQRQEALLVEIAEAQAKAEEFQAQCDAQSKGPRDGDRCDEVIGSLGYLVKVEALVTSNGAAAGALAHGLIAISESEVPCENGSGGSQDGEASFEMVRLKDAATSDAGLGTTDSRPGGQSGRCVQTTIEGGYLTGSDFSMVLTHPVSFDAAGLESAGTMDIVLPFHVKIAGERFLQDVTVSIHADSQDFTATPFNSPSGAGVTNIRGKRIAIAQAIMGNHWWLETIRTEAGGYFTKLKKIIEVAWTEANAAYEIINNEIKNLKTDTDTLLIWQERFKKEYDKNQTALKSTLQIVIDAADRLKEDVATLTTNVHQFEKTSDARWTEAGQALERLQANQKALSKEIDVLQKEMHNIAENALRRDIYRALTCECCKPNFYFMLPDTLGGNLDATLALVYETIKLFEAAGGNGKKAWEAFNEANRCVAAADYPVAWKFLRKAVMHARFKPRNKDHDGEHDGDDDDHDDHDDTNHRKKDR